MRRHSRDTHSQSQALGGVVQAPSALDASAAADSAEAGIEVVHGSDELVVDV